jgi:hypothetical protein
MNSARLVLAIGVSALLLGGAANAADEPFGVSLMRSDGLAGWDHGQSPPQGWTFAGGQLRGTAGSTPLLSGWTFGDFELRFRWSVAAGGACGVTFPEVPAGKGLLLRLDETGQCGRLTDGDRLLAPGVPLPRTAEKMHTAALRRARGKLTLRVDQKQLFEVDVAPARRFGLQWAVAAGEAALSDPRLQEPLGQSIFNGRDLHDWWTPGDITAWTAKNNEIVWVKRGGSYIRTKKEFANFTLSCDYKIGKHGNSGVGIRTPHDGWPSGDGMELQIWDTPYEVGLTKQQTMAIYGNVPPLARCDLSQQWNHVVIKADGYMISAWMNGQLVQQSNTFHHPELKFRHLQGWIGFQDHTSGVEFKNIYVLEAPAGLGLAEWSRPRPATVGALMVDRLMNSERLSVVDGLVSGVATSAATEPAPFRPQKVEPKKTSAKKAGSRKKSGTPAAASTSAATPAGSGIAGEKQPAPPAATAPSKPAAAAPPLPSTAPPASVPSTLKKMPSKKERRVLARLTGPGAVVRVARSTDEGRLAFYFDGEEKPRLECLPNELWKTAPELAIDTNPVLTCLAYRKSLTVVLRDGATADYRIDYVTCPPQVQVETFTGPESGFPRGWLAGLAYRHEHHMHGTQREFDPLPRLTAAPRSIEPGKTQQLLHADGAGIVQWLKLTAGTKKVLANNDLWLEATIDGEPQPAIAAPARYWFPGLAGHGNYHNFVLLERAGVTSYLAMPFGRGMTISARNAGSKPLDKIGLIISLQPATDATRADILRRLRLRGVFLPAGQRDRELANLAGAGRWVGLVYQEPKGAPGGIEYLAVDGAARSGWAAPTLDAFLGYLDEDVHRSLSGRQGSLVWRYLLLDPVDFQQSLVLKARGKSTGDRLVLYYAFSL